MAMRRLFYFLAAGALMLAGCSRDNDMVLDIDDMASLMADIHIAEAVVDLNHNDFPDDSSKMVLKQSIYAAHGVTAAQVDSSYSWYGRHIEDYMKVYDRTLKILNDRQDELLTASSERIAIAGDSVDVWPLCSHFEFSRRSVARLVTFSVPVDSNWRDNDVFTLRFNMASAIRPVTARMVVEYADGTSGYNLTAGRNYGRGEVSLRVDSTLSPVRIAGYIITSPEDNEVVRLDSISLIRLRSHIAKKYFSQRQFNYGIERERKTSVTDSVAGADSHRAKADSVASPNGGTVGSQVSARHGAARQVAHSPGQTAPKGHGSSAAQESVRQRDELIKASRRRK